MQPETIPDWGVDLDPRKRPAYPKEKAPPGGTGAHWSVPEQQISDVEVFHSTERPGITHVFGTTCPPRGLSGVIRRYAYTWSETRLQRWFLMMAADRVDVVEGVLVDLSRGHVPNLWKEMGLNADLKHNKKRLVRLALMGGLAGAGVYGVGSAMGRRRARRAAESRPRRTWSAAKPGVTVVVRRRVRTRSYDTTT